MTRQPGLDPLWVLNHMHYLDSGRDGRWPLTFSRYAGPGSHRYPVGFSGDTIVTWESLQFQPYFTATASNIGYGWWSHDIGGHMCGYRNEHLEARWYQLGTFSPINRLHSSSSPFTGKEPWNFSGDVHAAMVASLRLRHMLLPYLYTMNYRAALDGRPLVEPMYWSEPNNPQAYEVPDEFRFGTELLVAPIVTDDDPTAQRGRTEAWLPQGEWYDFFDGRRYVSDNASGRRLEVWRALDRIPVFAKAGGIIPLQELATGDDVNDLRNPSVLHVLVFPGADGTFTLREDDGIVSCARRAHIADTMMTFDWRADIADSAKDGDATGSGGSRFEISPVDGAVESVPERRDWTIVFRGVSPVGTGELQITINGIACETVEIAYDEQTLSLSIAVHDVPSTARLSVIVPKGLSVADNPIDKDVLDALLHAQMPYITKEHALQAIREQGVRAVGALRTLDGKPRFSKEPFVAYGMPDAVNGVLEEILLRS